MREGGGGALGGGGVQTDHRNGLDKEKAVDVVEGKL